MYNKIKCALVFFLCSIASIAQAQINYELLPIAADNFYDDRHSQYDEIIIKWSMEGSIQADLNDGINFLHENKYALAKKSMSLVLKKDSTLWQAYYYRGIASKQQKQYNEAVFDLRMAVRLNPNFYEGQVELAKCYLAGNFPLESERSVKRAIQIDKKRSPAYFVKGNIHSVLRQTATAISSYEECLKYDSFYVDARIGIALVSLLNDKNQLRAMRELDEVLRLDTLQKDALLIRSILVFNNNEQQTVHDLGKLISISPGNLMAYYLRAYLYSEMKDYHRAFNDFQVVIKMTSTDENRFRGQQSWIDKKIDIQNVGAYTLTRLYGLPEEDVKKLKQAFCLIITGALDKSIAVLSKTSDPDGEPLVVYLRAVAHEHQGKHKQAFLLYNEAIEKDNTIADAYKKRAIYEQEMKRWDASIDDLTKVLRLLPEAFIIFKIRGVSYYHSNQYQKAIADFSSYLKRDSTDLDVIGSRGMAHHAINERFDAYIDFANSRNIQAFDSGDMMHLLDSILQQGDTTKVLSALTAFITAKPTFTEAYGLKMKLHIIQNDRERIARGLPEVMNHDIALVKTEDRVYLLTLRAMWLDRSNDSEVRAAFDRAVFADGENAFARLERGKFLLAKKKTSSALIDLKKSAASGNLEAAKILASLTK